MSFASPVFLAALALVPLVLGVYVLARRRARRYAVRFPGVATLAPLLPRVSAWRRRLPLALFLAALAALALALARPHATVAVPQEQASIVLVTDVSRSMLADDVEPEPPRGGALGRQALPRPGARRGPRGRRRVLDGPAHGRAADRRPRQGRATCSTASAPTAARPPATRSQAALALVDKGPRAKRPPAAIVLLSDGETTIGRDPTDVARDGQAQGHPDLTRWRSARAARRSGRRPAPRSRCRPTPSHDAPDRRALGRPRVPGRGRRPTCRGSTRASARASRARRSSARSRRPSPRAARSCWPPQPPSGLRATARLP